MNSALMKNLLDLGDAFEQTHPDRAEQTLPNFLAWSSRQQSAAGPDQPDDALKDPEATYYADDVPVLQTFVSESITKIYRYLKVYIKTAIPMITFDEFISLCYLAERGSMTKTDLVEVTINEKTSGMLIIKRLIDRGFVVQSDDVADKRSRRLTLTPAGFETLRQVQPAMNQATELFTGDLSKTEQRQLAALLARLDKFHEPIYLAHMAHRDMSLDALKGVVINQPGRFDKST